MYARGLDIFTAGKLKRVTCCISTNDAERSGGLIEANAFENFQKIQDMVLVDRRIKMREIVSAKSFHMTVWFRFEMISWV